MPKLVLNRYPTASGSCIYFFNFAPEIRLTKKVFIAVDTSDSCWPRIRNVFRPFLKSLLGCLDIGDTCEVWQFGKNTPAIKVKLTQDYIVNDALVDILRALDSVRYGTWLAGTIDKIVDEAKKTGDLEYPCIVVVTDGEIFDLDLVRKRWCTKTPALVVLSDGDREILLPGVREVELGDPTVFGIINDFLKTDGTEDFEVQLMLSAGEEVSDLWRYEYQVDHVVFEHIDKGELVSGIHSRDGIFNIAVIGKTEPEVRLQYPMNGKTFVQRVDTVVQTVSDKDRNTLFLARRIEGHSMVWRQEVLETLLLATKASEEEGPYAVRCSVCAKAPYDAMKLKHQNLYCTACGALLLCYGKVESNDTPILERQQHAVFRRNGDGTFTEMTSKNAADILRRERTRLIESCYLSASGANTGEVLLVTRLEVH